MEMCTGLIFKSEADIGDVCFDFLLQPHWR
jgi:hypothetical protein